jgi:uncharacterized protein involved in exopolysaccharide biosynthesis
MSEPQTIRPEIESEEEINLLEMLRVVVRNLPLIVKITAAAAILSVIYSLTLKNVYSAKATLLPPQKDSGGGGAAALLASVGGGLAGLAGGLGGSADLYLGILKSRSVTDAVIKRLDLQTEFESENADATRTVLQCLVRFQAGKDSIITITADYKDPAKAALLANTFVDELQKRSLQLNLTKASTERSFLEKRLAVVKQDLKSAEEVMKSFQEKVVPTAGNAPYFGVEYVRRLRELKTQEALFEQLTKQFELAKINEARDSSSIQVLDEAVTPLRKSKPKRSQIVILSTLTAFFCSIFTVFIKEYLAKLSPEDGAIMDDMKGTLKGMIRFRGSTKLRG